MARLKVPNHAGSRVKRCQMYFAWRCTLLKRTHRDMPKRKRKPSRLPASLTRVVALPLTLFRYEELAQRHCPEDIVVWLDFRKRIYYSNDQKYYARGRDGSFVCRNEARSSGYRRSLLGLR